MSTDLPLKETPLHAAHVRLGAKMVDFGGWSMPVQYSGILEEHRTVRSAVGVFDISHMGQFFVSGENAALWLNALLTNNIEKLAVGQCQYTFLLNEEGGVIDDLIAYRIGATNYLLVVNAAKIEEDFAWMQAHLQAGVTFSNESDSYAGLAVQGPNAAALFPVLFEGATLPVRSSVLTLELESGTVYVARTGYTGEDGYEIFCPASRAEAVWNDILEKGAAFGLKPCGLGSRDTLRLEVCYPLNGSDLSPTITPLEAGLGFFVDLQKPAFIGRARLAAQKADGIERKLMPFRMVGKCPPPRSHYPVFKNGEQVSETCSGSLSPSLNAGIGMTYLPVALAKVGEEIEIEIRGKRFPAVLEKKPLLRPNV